MNKKLLFREDLILLIFAIFLSIASFLYFYLNQQQNLGNFDALSRLNIARKIVDNLTPGLAQLGSVWLPLPQLAMLPFIWNDFLWHSGVAGAIGSSLSYIFSTVYLYKLLKLLFKDKFIQILGVLIFLTNINILLLQTMAMSELYIIFFLISATYYLTTWGINNNLADVLKAGALISLATLTRYEGYALFLFSSLILLIMLLLKYPKKLRKVEGVTILFLTLAGFGVFIWLLYLTLIFKNPFYSFDIYSHKIGVLSNTGNLANNQTVSYPELTVPLANGLKGVPLITAFQKTFWAVFLMNGIITSAFAVFGFIIFILTFLKKTLKEEIHYLPLFVLLSPFVFVLLAVFRGNIPLNLPYWNVTDLLNNHINLSEEYNIRYGIQLLPFVVIFVSVLLDKGKITKIILSSFIFIQILSIFTPLYLIYRLDTKWSNGGQIGHYEDDATHWLSQNYDGGLIIISAFKHDPAMFKLGLPYKTYIHEGTSNYWYKSLENPMKYATWIYMSTDKKSLSQTERDPVTSFLWDSSYLLNDYTLKYNDENIVIYKIKTKPEIEVQ